jgi:hypothetical protein
MNTILNYDTQFGISLVSAQIYFLFSFRIIILYRWVQAVHQKHYFMSLAFQGEFDPVHSSGFKISVGGETDIISMLMHVLSPIRVRVYGWNADNDSVQGRLHATTLRVVRCCKSTCLSQDVLAFSNTLKRSIVLRTAYIELQTAIKRCKCYQINPDALIIHDCELRKHIGPFRQHQV